MSRKLSAKEVRDKLENDTLDLSLCDLDEVPVKEISALKRFTTLDLSNNILKSLPKNFAILTQIVKLDLSKNVLQDLPDNFGELKQLRHLDLYSNKISTLPVSLGELKNLKWLDLKENPLTPTLAAVAGPCSNSSQCQACAKNVVIYLANMKISMEEEKLKRIAAAQEAEKAAAANSKKENKKKKKAEKKANEKDKSPNVKKEQPQEKNNASKSQKAKPANDYSNKSKNSSGGVCSLLCRAFTSLIMWSAFFTLLTVTALAIFPLCDEQRSEEFFKYAETQMGIPLKYYHHEGIRLLETFMDNAKLWTNHTRGLIEKTYKEYFVEQATISDKKEF